MEGEQPGLRAPAFGHFSGDFWFLAFRFSFSGFFSISASCYLLLVLLISALRRRWLLAAPIATARPQIRTRKAKEDTAIDTHTEVPRGTDSSHGHGD